MSYLDRARSAASQVADQARQTAGQLADRAAEPAARERLRDQLDGGVRSAGRRMRTTVERIDPGTLADLIIKATAVQEMTNRALKERRSPYRISEVTVAATIPPGVNFTIGRVGDEDADEVTTSTELVAAAAEEATIVSLGGEAELAELAELAEAEMAGGAAPAGTEDARSPVS